MALRGDKRMPQEDVKYVQLINAAMKLANDSAEVDSLNKKLAVVSDTYLPNHTQRLAVDSVKENKGLTLLLLSGIKDLYAELQRGEEGIPYFTQYLEIMGDSATWRDQMSLADLYQKISRTDSINQMMYIEKADSLYEQIAVAMENGKLDGYTKELVVYMPWFQRAQLWILNPQEAEEKPKTYYEKALELLPESSMFDARRKICAQYLMVYYFKTDNDDECMKYLEQVLILDPNNRIANQILEVLMM
jgi:tetratricopeptide (TPR) repeat protein